MHLKAGAAISPSRRRGFSYRGFDEDIKIAKASARLMA